MIARRDEHRDREPAQSGAQRLRCLGKHAAGIKDISREEQKIRAQSQGLVGKDRGQPAEFGPAQSRLFGTEPLESRVQMQVRGVEDPDAHGCRRTASAAVHSPVSVSRVKTAPSSFEGPFASA